VGEATARNDYGDGFLVDLLAAIGWTGLYARRHDTYAIVQDTTALCPCGDLTTGTGTPSPGLGPLVTTLSSSSRPMYSFGTANLCDDVHDCLISAGDT
jgi:hypothetical protein